MILWTYRALHSIIIAIERHKLVVGEPRIFASTLPLRFNHCGDRSLWCELDLQVRARVSETE